MTIKYKADVPAHPRRQAHPGRLDLARRAAYVDIAHRVRITPGLVEFVDLFLDVMIDGGRSVSEKDEHQLAVLSPELRRSRARPATRCAALIDRRDAFFDAKSAYFVIPAAAAGLPAPTDPIAL